MHKDLEALLNVQERDAGLRKVDDRRAALDAQERALDDELSEARAAIERSRSALEREEGKRSALALKVEEHRQLHQRNVAQLDQVRRMREATAAATQIEMARQILAEEERELGAMDRRIAALRQALDEHEMNAEQLVETQRERRDELAGSREELAGQRQDLAGERDAAAGQVPRTLLQRYERIRDRRRGDAVFPLRGLACGNCDTAIPLMRRNVIADGASTDVCEACGVLLYLPSH